MKPWPTMHVLKIRRVPANSLLITVIISLVIGILCSLLILLAYNNLQTREMIVTQDKLERNLQSAINLTLADSTIAITPEINNIDLFGEGNDSATIKKETWGLLNVASVTVSINGKTKERHFFYGQSLADNALSGCLYVAEHQEYLSIVGNTRLTGDAYLPRGGLRPAIIDQRGFGSSELIKGSIKISSDSLPALNASLLQYLSQLEAGSTDNDNTSIPDSLDQSFGDSIFTIHQHGSLVLSSCTLKGHILIIADSMITVNSDANLQNVLLSAPVIKFEDGFSGSVQAIATDSIITKNNCRFLYPSAFCIIKKEDTHEQPGIYIGDSSLFEGAIITAAPFNDQYKTTAAIGKNTTIKGMLYISGFLSFNGAVNGIVLTDHFIYRSSASIYENYLVDGVIDRSALSTYFILPPVFNTKKVKQLIQWVD
jgi:hypothetical protein